MQHTKALADLVVPLRAAAGKDASAVGGKGRNLGRLHRYGFPAPEGGMLTVATYREFMAAPELQALQAELEGVSAEDAAGAEAAGKLDVLREVIKATPFPDSIAGPVRRFLAESGLDRTPVAVRSSATAEDGPEASFAGIHHDG